MKNPKSTIFKSELVRNASVLVSGSVLGQAITILASMVLTRIYTQDAFGIFYTFMSITTILSFIATGKYEEAIVITSNNKHATSLTGLSLSTSFFFSLLLCIILYFFGSTIFSFFNMKSLGEYCLLIPLMTFLISVARILTNVANREKQYKSIAVFNMTQNTVSSLSKIFINPILSNSWGLLGGQILSYIVACIPFYKLRQKVKTAIQSSQKDIKEAAKTYREYPQYNTPRSLISSISTDLPFLVLAGIFGEARLGLFGLASNMSFRPISLLVGSFQQVFVEKCANLKNENKKISPIVYSYWKKTLLFILPLFIILFIFAPPLFGFLFGSEWRESGEILRYILPWRFMALLNYPMDFLPLLFRKQGFHASMEIVVFILRLIAIFAGVYLMNFNLSIMLYGTVGFLYIVALFIWYNQIIRKYESSL